MSVSFEDVTAGDRVKLTRENGDESTFLVASVWESETTVEDRFDTHYYDKEWDTLEILPKPLPTGLWALVVPPEGSGGAPYLLTHAGWRLVYGTGTKEVDGGVVQEYVRDDGFTVAFEGVQDA